MSTQIPITNPRIRDNEFLWEAFSGINNARTYGEFGIPDNYWIYLAILGSTGADVHIKGDIDCSANPNFPAATIGDIYRVSVAGKIGGAAGFKVSAGDMLFCFVTGAAGTYAGVGANWDIQEGGLQRIWEVNFTTQDATGTFARDLIFNVTRDINSMVIGRDWIMGVTRDWTQSVGNNYSLGIVGTYSLSSSNFGVATNGKVTVGSVAGSLSIGTGVGYDPLLVGNTFVGVSAAAAITTGHDNAAFGWTALNHNTTGFHNTALGAEALYTNTTGNNNTAVGEEALYSNTTASGNTALGSSAMFSNTTGASNCAMGPNTMFNNTTGNYNTGLGAGALQSNTTADGNTAVGFQASLANTTGTFNCALGYQALLVATTANYNIAIGYLTMQATTTGGHNTAIGVQACYSNTTGNNNTAVGDFALYTGTTVDGRVGLGYYAGFYETGANKLFIDNQDRTNEATARLQSLVYGIFAATTATQFLTVNAHLLVREDLQFTTKAIDTTAGDAATINSPAGRFRKDNSGATFTLINSYITANSIIQLTPANAAVDATAITWTVSAGAGSAVITFGAAPTANLDMNFLVIN